MKKRRARLTSKSRLELLKEIDLLRSQRDELYKRIDSWQAKGASGCRFYADIGNRTPWCKKCGEHLYDH